MIVVLGGAFGMLCVGGALVHVWSISWGSRFGALSVYKYTFGDYKYYNLHQVSLMLKCMYLI